MPTSKIRLRLISLLFLSLMLVAADRLLVFCLEPVDYNWFFNRILEKSGEKTGQIDMVIIGASRGQRSFDPVIIGEVLGLDSVFNASSGYQLISSSYFQLKDIVEKYHPRYVVMDLTWNRLYDRDSLQSRLINLGRIHGRNKIDFIRETFNCSELLRVISGAYRNRGFFVPSHIQETVNEKMILRQNNCAERTAGEDLYTDNGFLYSSHSQPITDYPEDRNFSADEIDPQALSYLDRIVELCDENNALLFFVAPPTSLMDLFHLPDYQAAVDFYTEYARKHGTVYHDLNLLKGRNEWLSDENMMYDQGHVSGEGAERVSRRYAQILRDTLAGSPTNDYFYVNYAALRADIDGIVSVGAQIIIQDSIAHVRLSSVYPEGIEPEYKLEISQNDSDYKTVIDWSDHVDAEFYVTEYSGSVFFRVSARDCETQRSIVRVIEKDL